MKLYRVITWKLLCDTQWLSDVFSTCNGRLYEVQSSCRRPLEVQRTSDAHWLGEGMTLLIGEDVNLLKGVFLVGKMRKFMTTKWYSHPSPGFPRKVQVKRRQSTLVEGTKKHQRRGRLWSKGGYREYNCER